MTNDQIKLYFVQHSGKRTCGHFYKGQLKANKNKTQMYITDIYCSAYIHIKTKALRFVILFILGGALTVAGCSTPTQGEVIERHQQITGDSIALVPMDTARIDTTKMA